MARRRIARRGVSARTPKRWQKRAFLLLFALALALLVAPYAVRVYRTSVRGSRVSLSVKGHPGVAGGVVVTLHGDPEVREFRSVLMWMSPGGEPLWGMVCVPGMIRGYLSFAYGQTPPGMRQTIPEPPQTPRQPVPGDTVVVRADYSCHWDWERNPAAGSVVHAYRIQGDGTWTQDDTKIVSADLPR